MRRAETLGSDKSIMTKAWKTAGERMIGKLKLSSRGQLLQGRRCNLSQKCRQGTEGHATGTHMGYNEAALLHLLAHARRHHGRGRRLRLHARQLVREGVTEPHALAKAHVAISVLGRACKGARRLRAQLFRLLFPLPDLRTG